MQGQRYWVERALQEAKGEIGMGQYQVRHWTGWHHHIALSMMALWFTLETRIALQVTYPLLSCPDIRTLMIHFLPKRDSSTEEIFRQMHYWHLQRQKAIDNKLVRATANG